MNDPTTLDQRLLAAFSLLDVRQGFDARLMARVHAEARRDAARLAALARQHEQLRYGMARQELISWRGWTQLFSRWVTLELAGIAALLVGVVATTWSSDEMRHYTPEIFTALGILAALSPLIPGALQKLRPTPDV